MLQGLSGQWFVARQSKGQGQKSQVLSGPQHAILVIAVLSTLSSSYEFQLQGAPFTSQNSGVSESRGTRGSWAGGGAGETTAVLSTSPKGGSLQTIVGEAKSDPITWWQIRTVFMIQRALFFTPSLLSLSTCCSSFIPFIFLLENSYSCSRPQLKHDF